MGMCREYNNSFYADAECAQELLGLPGRVFLNQLPESTPDVDRYTLKEYPQRDLALRCGIRSSLAVPVFDHSSHTCVGVLEIVSVIRMYQVSVWHDKSFLGQMYDIFQEFGLLCFDEHKHYEMQIGDENKTCAFQELKTVLETVCKIHELPLAMTWVPCKACNYLLRGQLLSEGVEFGGHENYFLALFVEVSKCSHLRKGGVAGMVLSSPNMLYCSDITQLSLVEYPLVPYARLCNLRGWFTICLQSSYTANDVYVLEVFLPRSSKNSWTSLSLILGTMEENFRTFKLASGQELGNVLSVEVMNFQEGQKFHSVQNIQAKGGGVMLQLRQLDQASTGAIHSGTNVVSEDQTNILPSLGSVHDADTILGVKELNHFPPNFQEYIQKEQLNCSRIEGDEDIFGRPTFRWVFWSQQDHQIQLDKFADLIRHALQKLIFKEQLLGHLVQFWAPTKMSQGRTLLTTQFQPFALGTTYTTDARNLICEYRMGMCREYSSFYTDAVSGEEQLGLPGRVFVNKLPESTLDVEHYTLFEYPQRDLALRCKIGSSWAEPVFDHSSHSCVGVLEIVSLAFMSHVLLHKSIHGLMYDIFKEFDLICFYGCKHYEMQIGDANKACTTAFQELKTVLETVCKIHELPLAMTWVPCTACDDLLRGQLLSEGVEFCGHGNFNIPMFVEVSKCSHLRKGGVAGMVLSSPNMLYCSDITQLSVVEYPLVPYARRCKFGGWFTICLQTSYTANDNYVLEFFLPRRNRYGYNSRTTLSLILGTMEENFKTFKLASGQELGDLLSVEFMDFQNGLKLHSVQKIQAKGGGVMLQLRQLDQASTGAIHSGTNVVSEDQNYILRSLEALENEEVTMQLDSSHQPPLDPPNNGQNVVIAERNIVMVTSSDSEGGPRETQERQHKNTGLRIEVSLDDILKYSKQSRNDAANKLQVSVSTLKRVCRGYGIDQWPPRNIKKSRSFWPSPVENEGQTRQRLNSDLPSIQESDTVAHPKPAFQDGDIVTIRAKYENNTIKFRLSLPCRLVALQQEVAKRLDLEAGTYYVRYKDGENELIIIACDEDLQDCIHCVKSLGKTEVVVLLELK